MKATIFALCCIALTGCVSSGSSRPHNASVAADPDPPSIQKNRVTCMNAYFAEVERYKRAGWSDKVAHERANRVTDNCMGKTRPDN